MDYLDSGYDQYFQRDVHPVSTEKQQITEAEFDAKYAGIPADKLVGGEFTSANGNIAFSLEDGKIVVRSGELKRIVLGDLDVDGVGLVIYSKEGNEILKISDNFNFIKSPDGNLVFNFDENRIEIFDNGIMQTILGKIA
jgi:hypothetical protein